MSRWVPRRRATSVTATVIAGLMVVFLAWLMLSPLRLEQRLPDGITAAQEFLASTLGPEYAKIGWMDAFANGSVFLVVGVLAYLILPRRAWFVALLVPPVLSALLELIQAVALPNRVADPRDVLAALVGGAIGVCLAVLCTALTARRRPLEGSA